MEDKSGMRPGMGDTNMTLPVTFDYSGGRQEKSRSRVLYVLVISAVVLIIVLGTLFGKNPWYVRIPLGLGEAFLYTLFLRFIVFKESKKKAKYKEILASDMEMFYPDIWGIYMVEEEYPYFCRFRNGKSGLYIRLNKDVILGKYEESEYNHYEAVADAYNLAGSGHIQMMHLDYMASVGSDERLEESFKALADVPNPDIKDLLTDIYSYQQVSMKHRVTTYDVYAFIWTGNDITAWNQIVRILNCFLDANYRSYRVLNQREIRELVKEVFNLNDFSVMEASTQAFDEGRSSTLSSSVIPISVVDASGEEIKINKTLAEKEEERKQKDEAERKISSGNKNSEVVTNQNRGNKKPTKGKVTETDESHVYDDVF